MNFFQRLNIKRDKRTLFNFCKLPIIICVRIPAMIIFIFIKWIHDKLDVMTDNLPGWET